MNTLKNPMSAHQILDTYFMENRARLLEIASFLDRLDRSFEGPNLVNDYRYRSFIRGIALLLETNLPRTKEIQLSFSDHSEEPVESAAGLKATGAWQGGAE